MEFIVVLLLLLILLLLFPALLKKAGVPMLIALIIAGMVCGPNGLDLIGLVMSFLNASEPDIYAMDFTLNSLAQLGLIFLMALAGLEISPRILRKQKKGIAIFAFLSAVIPAIIGLLIGVMFGLSLPGTVLLVSIFMSHSVAVAYALIKELKVITSRFGVVLLGGTLIIDISSLVLLGFAINLKSPGHSFVDADISLLALLPVGDNVFVTSILFIVFIIVFIIVVMKLASKLTGVLFDRIMPHDPRKLTLLLIFIFIVVLLGALIGLHVIVGAFIAGLAIADSLPIKEEQRLLHRRLNAIGFGIFIPIFFFVIGTQVDLSVLLESPKNVLVVIVIIFGVVLSKLLSGFIAFRLLDFDNRKSVVGGLLTIPQLSATLAAAEIGRELDLLPPEYFTAIVVLAIVTMIPSPIIAKNLVSRWGLKFVDTIPDAEMYIYSLEPPPKNPLYEPARKEEEVLIYEMEVPQEELTGSGEVVQDQLNNIFDVLNDETEDEQKIR